MRPRPAVLLWPAPLQPRRLIIKESAAAQSQLRSSASYSDCCCSVAWLHGFFAAGDGITPPPITWTWTGRFKTTLRSWRTHPHLEPIPSRIWLVSLGNARSHGGVPAIVENGSCITKRTSVPCLTTMMAALMSTFSRLCIARSGLNLATGDSGGDRPDQGRAERPASRGCTRSRPRRSSISANQSRPAHPVPARCMATSHPRSSSISATLAARAHRLHPQRRRAVRRRRSPY